MGAAACPLTRNMLAPIGQLGQPGLTACLPRREVAGLTGNEVLTQDRSLLSEKELLYLKDALSWELLAIKKCHEMAGQCQDQQVANLIRQTGKKHVQHYNELLSLLQ